MVQLPTWTTETDDNFLCVGNHIAVAGIRHPVFVNPREQEVRCREGKQPAVAYRLNKVQRPHVREWTIKNKYRRYIPLDKGIQHVALYLLQIAAKDAIHLWR